MLFALVSGEYGKQGLFIGIQIKIGYSSLGIVHRYIDVAGIDAVRDSACVFPADSACIVDPCNLSEGGTVYDAAADLVKSGNPADIILALYRSGKAAVLYNPVVVSDNSPDNHRASLRS